MKNKLIYIALAVLFLFSCKKDQAPIFDDPDTRLTEALAADQAKLLSATNGWKATIYPVGGKGFSFYFKFSADGKVNMMSDINSTSSTVPVESTYRLKALQRPTLIFDTYNYIHLVADPDASISGGSNASGLRSDFEFAFASVSGDTLKFDGTFNGNKMQMVSLSTAESQSILAGGLKIMNESNVAYIVATKNPYIQFGDGTKGAISIDATARVIKLTYLDSKGVVQTKSVTFAYGINKLLLSAYLNYGDTYFKELLYDSANKVYYIMNGTTRINLQNSATPIIPLSLQFGFPSAFSYRKITIPSAGLPSGVTSGFNTAYNQMLALFTGSGRSVTSTTFSLTSNTDFLVEVTYSSGTSSFVASATYKYTRVGDVITLDNNPVGNVNWPTRAVQIKPLADYMLTGPFRIDWVASTNPSSPLLGGLYRTADANSFIYGTL